MNNNETVEEIENDDHISDIRHADLPAYKEQVMSQLFGEFIGFLKSKNLTQGKEFEIKVKEIFQCSQKIVWIDQYDQDYRITVVFNSMMMSVEYGYVKKPSEVIHRNKLEDLRYNISPGTNLELIDSHKTKYETFVNEIKSYFDKLKPNYNG